MKLFLTEVWFNLYFIPVLGVMFTTLIILPAVFLWGMVDPHGASRFLGTMIEFCDKQAAEVRAAQAKLDKLRAKP